MWITGMKRDGQVKKDRGNNDNFVVLKRRLKNENTYIWYNYKS